MSKPEPFMFRGSPFTLTPNPGAKNIMGKQTYVVRCERCESDLPSPAIVYPEPWCAGHLAMHHGGRPV